MAVDPLRNVPQTGIVRFKNTSGQVRNRFDVLGITDVFPTPAANPNAFKSGAVLHGVTPDKEEHAGEVEMLTPKRVAMPPEETLDSARMERPIWVYVRNTLLHLGVEVVFDPELKRPCWSAFEIHVSGQIVVIDYSDFLVADPAGDLDSHHGETGMTMGLARLRELFPWPPEKPAVEPVDKGWFSPTHQPALGQFLSQETNLVIELGSWVGGSIRWFLNHAPHATVIAVDTWLGSPEHYNRQPLLLGQLPTVYEAFLVNCRQYRRRLIPMRTSTLVGLRLIKQAGLSPDLIYVDADHQYWAVKADVESAHKLFPRARLVGHDYNWPSVRQAVNELGRTSGRTPKARHPAVIDLHGQSVESENRAARVDQMPADAAKPRCPGRLAVGPPRAFDAAPDHAPR